MTRNWLLAASVLLSACGADADSWHGIRNPFLGYPDVAIKDAFAVRDDAGTWHLGYSELSDPPFRVRLGFAASPDLVTFTRGETLDQPSVGGLASPDVVRAPDGRYVMTYNSHMHDEGDTANKLYYRTSQDLETWSEPHRIHITGADAATDRLIDAALAFTDSGTFIVFKREQTAAVAHSPSGSLDGPWQLVGDINQGNTENAQLLRIDETWHMLATTIPLIHEPRLYRLAGDPSDPVAWTSWTHVATFEIQAQAWNTGPFLDHEVANAAYLVDAIADDGFYYLVYAGSTELSTFELRGHSSLGIARSRDLVTWEPAPAQR